MSASDTLDLLRRVEAFSEEWYDDLAERAALYNEEREKLLAELQKRKLGVVSYRDDLPLAPKPLVDYGRKVLARKRAQQAGMMPGGQANVGDSTEAPSEPVQRTEHQT